MTNYYNCDIIITGNTNRWMDIQYDSTAAGYHIQHYDYGAVPTLNFNRGALFKFAQIGTTGRYVIRLMTNNLLSFCILGLVKVQAFILWW